MLNHPKIDIFIHMYAKNKSYDPAETLKLVKFSRIFHVPRIKVSWGGFSTVEATLTLLDFATSKGEYEHYHLVSGADLPIQKHDDIIAFFEQHHGTEFIHFTGETSSYVDRVKYYYPFQELKGRKGNIFIRAITKVCKKLPERCRVVQHNR